jgi:hypothetical protein
MAGFLGVAVAQMKLDYFKTLFQRLVLEPHGFIRLISTDGTPLTQHPEPDAADAHTNLSNNPVFIRFLQEHRGSFIALSSIDGEERLYNFSEVGDLPLIVVVSLATDDVFSAWRRNAILVGIGTLLLCGALLMLTWLLGRELQLRQRAERQLEALATTDPLTGLANRRKLDQTLEQEWRRAQRSGKPLSLIMFDIDHFKNFNDTYGHQDGDEALKRVAQTIPALHAPLHRSGGPLRWRRVCRCADRYRCQWRVQPGAKYSPGSRATGTVDALPSPAHHQHGGQYSPGETWRPACRFDQQRRSGPVSSQEGRAQLRHQCPRVVLSEYPP